MAFRRSTRRAEAEAAAEADAAIASMAERYSMACTLRAPRGEWELSVPPRSTARAADPAHWLLCKDCKSDEVPGAKYKPRVPLDRAANREWCAAHELGAPHLPAPSANSAPYATSRPLSASTQLARGSATRGGEWCEFCSERPPAATYVDKTRSLNLCEECLVLVGAAPAYSTPKPKPTPAPATPRSCKRANTKSEYDMILAVLPKDGAFDLRVLWSDGEILCHNARAFAKDAPVDVERFLERERNKGGASAQTACAAMAYVRSR